MKKDKQIKELFEILQTNQKITAEIMVMLINCLSDILKDCTEIQNGAISLMKQLKEGNEINVRTYIKQEGAVELSQMISKKINVCYKEYLNKYELMLKEYLNG